MDLERLKQKEVASLLGVDPRSIRNYEKELPPIPFFMDGATKLYRWGAVFSWWHSREFASILAATRKVKTDLVPIAESEARKEEALAEMAHLKLAETRRELIPRVEAVRFTAGLISSARSYLLGIPARLRSKIGPEHTALVDAEVRRSLKVLGGEEELERGA